MAVEYTLTCDACGVKIISSKVSEKDARARAQLDGRAYCGSGRDVCFSCRHDAANAARQVALGHSIGTQR